MKNKRNLRLYKLITKKEVANNILEIYKALRGKENLKYRLFLKTLVYAATNCPKPNLYLKPNNYFDKSFGFNKIHLERVFERYSKTSFYPGFGFRLKDIYGYLI